MTSGTYSKTTMMILCGIFAAVTAICSLITIPLGFTPTSCWAPQVSPFSQDSEAA